MNIASIICGRYARAAGRSLEAPGVQVRVIAIACVFSVGCLFLSPSVPAAEQAQSVTLVTYMQQRLGLTERQVRGGLGALLLLARERLPQPEFDELAQRVPNASQIMDTVQLQGVVTKPLDDSDDFEEALASLGIGRPLAAQFGPAVIDYLASAGYGQERDILARVLD